MATQEDLPEPPPEAQLIARLREAMVPHLSMREAARRAGMSPALWNQNEQGYRKPAPGVVLGWKATDDKLAAMALVVGATPEQLREAGRDDAARALEKLISRAPREVTQMIDAVNEAKLTDRQKKALIELIRRDMS